MGIYVFKRQALNDWLTCPECRSAHNLARDLIPRMLARSRMYAYQFEGYWANVGTIQAYYEANMALLAETTALDLYNPDWIIHTRSEERPAALIGPEARVEGNLLCDGCRVDGTVVRSIISPGVYIAPGAVVRDSIIMTDTVIEAGAEVDRAIIDKRVQVEAGAKVGWGDKNTPNRERPDRLNTGLTLVGKSAVVRKDTRIGRNVVIFPRVVARSKDGEEIASGSTLNA
jgi:glucose-1-phosphate adenylyltransferase